MRQGIVEKSAQILRKHGKSEEEIRFMMLCDFHIDKSRWIEILNTGAK